jgi:DNA replication protein DnaC
MSNNLQELLVSLDFKTPLDQIPEDLRDRLAGLLEKEKAYRQEWRIRRLLASSGMRPHQIRTFDSFDWSFNPRFPREDVLAFRNSSWVEEGANLLMIGDTGLGKSHTVKALCYDAILKGHSAIFITAFDLIAKIKKTVNLSAKVEYYGNVVRVLAIDELGYTAHSREEGDLLFQIISKRSERYPTLITTNLAPKHWGSIFSGPAASAILDRLSYKGTILKLEGEKTYRPTVKRK